MFGLLYLTANFVGATISGTIAASENLIAINQAKQRQKEGNNPLGIYIDRLGVTRDLKTNELVNGSHCKITGDLWIKRGNNIINISKQWRDEFYQYSKQHRVPEITVVNDIEVKPNLTPNSMKFNYLSWDDKYYCEGQWYKDLNNGELYVIRRECNLNFYMNINTRLYERLADEQVQTDIDNSKVKEIIDKHNSIVATKDFWNKREYYFNDLKTISSKRSREEKDMMKTFKPF